MPQIIIQQIIIQPIIIQPLRVRVYGGRGEVASLTVTTRRTNRREANMKDG
jgi:hypothetical protein